MRRTQVRQPFFRCFRSRSRQAPQRADLGKQRTVLYRVVAPLLMLALATPACSRQPAKEGIGPDQITANISPYNHTHEYIHQLYVDEAWGGNSFAYGGGGKFVCCVVYPKVWRAGLSAKIRWTTSSSDPNATGDAAKEKWHEKVVPIERYTEPGTTLNVHFLPGGEVRLIITSMSAGTPGYPGPSAPERPADFPFQRK
jgi:hypothetical protein